MRRATPENESKSPSITCLSGGSFSRYLSASASTRTARLAPHERSSTTVPRSDTVPSGSGGWRTRTVQLKMETINDIRARPPA